MKIKQLSVFLENEPGTLLKPCRILADSGINILTLALADTKEFGILRIIVKDWQTAKKILEQNGCVVKETDVVAIEVEDRPGGLLNILQALEPKKINLEYMYAFAYKKGGKAVLVLRFDKPDEAIQILQTKGFNVVGDLEFFKE
jgi:hypothetical protein